MRFAIAFVVLLLAGCEKDPVVEWKETMRQRCAAMKGIIAFEPEGITAECFRTPPFMMPKSLWKATYPEVPT